MKKTDIKKPNYIYVVTAYRWGEQSNHSYLLGAFQKKHKAMMVADEHCAYRGGKYACVVEQCIINEFDNEKDEYSKEIYRAKSVRS